METVLSDPKDGSPSVGTPVQIGQKVFETDSDGKAIHPFVLPGDEVTATAFKKFDMSAKPSNEGEIVTLDFSNHPDWPDYVTLTVNVRGVEGAEIDGAEITASPVLTVSQSNDSGVAEILLPANHDGQIVDAGKNLPQYRTARKEVPEGTGETDLTLVKKTHTTN